MRPSHLPPPRPILLTCHLACASPLATIAPSQLSAYIVYTTGLTGLIYPVVVHWVWDSSGFLSAGNPNHILGGVIDFAGSGVVHMTGGVASFVAAKILGPRIGRWDSPESFEGHSTPLQILGTFLLWFGWYGFNGGSTLTLHGNANTMARVGVTTTLSAAVSGCTGVLIKKYLPSKLGGTGDFDVGHTCNSILGGLVGVTAGCAAFTAPSSFLVGFMSAFVYHGASCMMRRLKIDDPLDAFAVHGACGFFGCLAVGLFTLDSYSTAPHGSSPLYGSGTDGGLLTGGGDGRLFAAQLVSCLIEVAWVGTTSLVLFGTLSYLGIFRVAEKDEMQGLDVSKHGGSAYRQSFMGELPTSTSGAPPAKVDPWKQWHAERDGTTPPASSIGDDSSIHNANRMHEVSDSDPWQEWHMKRGEPGHQIV
jgi:Amt family ammonium transporter